MRVTSDRRSALLLLALALLGTGARLVLGERGGGAPGAVAYRPSPARHDTADSAARDSLVARSLRLARPLRVGERIDVDQAPVEELARLPRVGPGLAARIVEERDAHGAFGSMDRLSARVAGIGQSLRTAITPYAIFSGVPERPAEGLVLRPGERLLVGADDPPPQKPVRKGRAVPTVPLNTASAGELAGLPGVGAVLAAAIVADRASRGPFRTLTDLRRVRGVTASLLKRLEGRLTVP